MDGGDYEETRREGKASFSSSMAWGGEKGKYKIRNQRREKGKQNGRWRLAMPRGVASMVR
ncbi:hypothetical protein COLO4_17641 [Corchorus olitorius]|uniref:Uncharacterized protein n=1 Tax=Corchorus olitorius TaxID=93759 RepID=A0A1R3JC30_9ROSI|nr:hypothetical protein COLO4_17641 [Corchorus olitorius]